MHAVVVSVTVHDREAAVSELNEQVVPRERTAPGFVASYWIALPTCEKTVLALEPIRRTVPTTITKMTASMTAYSAMSCPCSSCQSWLNKYATVVSPIAPQANKIDRAS